MSKFDVYVEEAQKNIQYLDSMVALSEIKKYYRAVSIDLHTIATAIAEGDTVTVRMMKRYFSAVRSRSSKQELKGLKKSTAAAVCDILDLYLKEHDTKGD